MEQTPVNVPEENHHTATIKNERIQSTAYLAKLALSILIFTVTFCSFTQASSPKPNILLIVADDATWTDFGFTGNSDVQTPHIDQLAKEGMQLTQMYSPAAQCSPTRHALYTGLYPIRSGAYPNHTRVYDKTQSVFTHLKKAGYRVALQGKQHVGPAASFPYEFLGSLTAKNKNKNPNNTKSTKNNFDITREFITKNRQQPWMLVFASNDPHTPWTRQGPDGRRNPESLKVPPYLHDNPTTRSLLADYYAEINKLDWQVGSLMKMLDDTQQTDNTLVIFISEQGSSFPMGGKWSLYDNGIRTATVARWPGNIEAGTTNDALMQYIDIPPTLMAVAGVDPKQINVGRKDTAGATGFDGKNFLNLLKGSASTIRDYVFAEHTTVGVTGYIDPYPIRAVRDTRYKYIRNLEPDNTFWIKGIHELPPYPSWRSDAENNPALAARIEWLSHRPGEELYDLSVDPYEENNLIEDAAFSTHKSRLSAQLDSWMLQQGDSGIATEALAPTRQKPGRNAKKRGHR